MHVTRLVDSPFFSFPPPSTFVLQIQFTFAFQKMPAPGQPRCKPRYFPSPGDEDTFDVDSDIDGKYFVVGAGRGTGIFTDV
jgi:hypothetical protein